MESWYAHTLGKLVVAYTGRRPPHPWTVYVADVICDDLEYAVQAVSPSVEQRRRPRGFLRSGRNEVAGHLLSASMPGTYQALQVTILISEFAVPVLHQPTRRPTKARGFARTSWTMSARWARSRLSSQLRLR